ncbi:MAG: type I glyceraldehyde-3-phosphate dehydrogenase [Alphaproteobacteria bacterium 16-39-46]|nr:MAG: type I glyceraldehyde-3-phosphate dehydrogenase [Alphaproteobacteria bacterium 16-39-46]OZA41669.1 MAG: type I glyceraldehyde-3-phosphate dehydrogenase [Alphaproteobacteria bacterium 17-39-52]HQS84755.1 type I glyceraldehyde-3-phosphate dehydrogenase [Alphaproteobacteria bacterium]HQS94567.1 type I glyceraldehyde-3-phosphate dehydrogenase [Alphaproteobacteria bacterium]
MTIRIAINGFGRIGRMILRAFLEARQKDPNSYKDLEFIAINDLGSVETNAHLFKYDSIHGPFQGSVEVKDGSLWVDGLSVKTLAIATPSELPWKELKIDIVFECSGRFTERSKAEEHLKAGAQKVLISAPAEGADLTIVYGVNQNKLKPNDQIISNASCTTNCLAPVAFVLNNHIGIERGYMTTIHAFTGDQSLVDSIHKDLRRARAATLSMIPSTTGAARAVGLVLPELKGKLDGTAIRVPVSNVSLVDLTFIAKRPTTPQEINDIMTEASQEQSLKGILNISSLPLVSIDFNHSSASATFDTTQTQVVENTLCRVLAWYDNEWGFSNRMLDTSIAIGKTLQN